MRFHILTLFPDMLTGYFNASILQRAQQAGQITIHLHNIRHHTTDKHHITDSPPYGGGGGMILKPGPIFRAIESIVGNEQSPIPNLQSPIPNPQSPIPNLQSPISNLQSPIILLTPQGRPFTQQVAQELTQHNQLILLSGRYEGIDERVRQHLVTDEISIGDYVLTGGELAAMVIVDAVARLLPGVLGAEDAAQTDSHATGLLEGPHYTRPETFRTHTVPPLLRSGHTAHITQWRRQQALRRTWQRRPDLLLTAPLTEQDKQFLATLASESSV